MKPDIKGLFESTGADAIILRTMPDAFDPSFFYFSQIRPGVLDNNLLILSPKKKPILVRSVIDPEIKNSNLRVCTVKRRKQMELLLSKELNCKKIGIDMSVVPVLMLKKFKKELKGSKFFDVSKQLDDARAIKMPFEISNIARAAKITEKALSELPSIFRKGMTEAELSLKLEFLLRKKSGDNIAFPVIVANGRNSAFPHHFPGSKKIKKGIVLIDCGAKFNGYCGDLTRVFCVGKPSVSQQNLYSTVFEAKRLGEELCVEGASAKKVFNQVSSFLKRHAGSELIHGLGHGLGLKVHDSPSGFTQESDVILKKNMVLTVEPGVYKSGFGIRIEDDVVVGKNKCRKLGNAPESLISLR